METQLVRLKPIDPRRGHVVKRYTYGGIKFQEDQVQTTGNPGQRQPEFVHRSGCHRDIRLGHLFSLEVVDRQPSGTASRAEKSHSHTVPDHGVGVQHNVVHFGPTPSFSISSANFRTLPG